MSNIPRKNDIIINPKTNRPIKVGGRAWKNLVNEGVIEGRYEDPKELSKITEDMDDNDIDEKIQSLDRKLPSNYQSVRGRGIYKDKIIKRRKPPKTKDLVKHTTKKSIKVIKENLDNLDFESELERMILEEVLKGDIPRDNSEEEVEEEEEKVEEVEESEGDYEYY
jgi:hypothetical protein